MGHHIYLIPPGDISSFLICHYLDAATYNTSTALIKISLLFQYLRVFDRGSWDYRASQVLLIIIAAWGCVFAFLAWFPCLPDPSSLWHRTGKGCYASGSSNFTIVVRWIEAHAGSNLILDLAVLSLAFRLLFTKDAPTTKRGMAVLLSMGLVWVLIPVHWDLWFIEAQSDHEIWSNSAIGPAVSPSGDWRKSSRAEQVSVTIYPGIYQDRHCYRFARFT